MQYRHDYDPILGGMKEQRVRKPVQQCTPERSMDNLVCEWLIFRSRDCSVDCVEKPVTKTRRDLAVPDPCIANIPFRERRDHHAFDHSDRSDALTSSHDSPSSGFC